MCKQIAPRTAERARAYFHKGNEPEPIFMSVIIALCECGSTWWAKTPTGVVWVEAEQEENRDIDDRAGEQFAADVAETKTENVAIKSPEETR